jgi:hypothetical protein
VKFYIIGKLGRVEENLLNSVQQWSISNGGRTFCGIGKVGYCGKNHLAHCYILIFLFPD